MKHTLGRIGLLAVLLSTLIAFAQDDDMGNGENDGMMGGEALGGSAETTVLAERRVDALPEGPLAWKVFDLAPVQDELEVTNPAPGFLYAHEGSHTVDIGGEETTLQEGKAVFVAPDAEFRLSDTNGLWHSVLLGPDTQAPAGLEEAEVLASSGELQNVPAAPVQLRFILVDLPVESRTAVHQHPGPEYIYVTRGEIEYETGISEAETLRQGDHRALPAATAVQKRNPAGDRAAFVSWFVVDPDMEFASEASLE